MALVPQGPQRISTESFLNTPAAGLKIRLAMLLVPSIVVDNLSNYLRDLVYDICYTKEGYASVLRSR
jgi:hypothetical protein